MADSIVNAVENRQLHHLITDVKIPTEMVVEIKDDGQKVEKEQKLFPSYVFVKMIMTDDSWYVVRNTRGVTGFVGPGSKPVPLSPAEIRSFGISSDDEEAKPVVEFAGKVGDQIKILSGAWEDTVGEIVSINEGKQCVTINVEMFGRETPVEIDFTDVKLL